MTTLTNAAGVPTATVAPSNGTFYSSPIAPTATATGPAVSHAAAGKIAPIGGFLAAVLALAAAL